MRLALLVFFFLVVAGATPCVLATLPQVKVPSGVSLAVPADTKLHLGDKWIYPQTVSLTLTVWNVSGWVNYTVPGAGFQEVYYGSEPVAVYIDGSHHGEGDGWTYSSEIVTVSVALASVALQYASAEVVPVVPVLPQTATNPQTVHFEASLDGVGVSGCEIRLYENATNEYVQTLITGANGKAEANLKVGIYAYEAVYLGKRAEGNWMHIEEETVRIVFTEASPVGTGSVETAPVLMYAVGGIIIVAGVLVLFLVKKRLVG